MHRAVINKNDDQRTIAAKSTGSRHPVDAARGDESLSARHVCLRVSRTRDQDQIRPPGVHMYLYVLGFSGLYHHSYEVHAKRTLRRIKESKDLYQFVARSKSFSRARY